MKTTKKSTSIYKTTVIWITDVINWINKSKTQWKGRTKRKNCRGLNWRKLSVISGDNYLAYHLWYPLQLHSGHYQMVAHEFIFWEHLKMDGRQLYYMQMYQMYAKTPPPNCNGSLWLKVIFPLSHHLISFLEKNSCYGREKDWQHGVSPLMNCTQTREKLFFQLPVVCSTALIMDFR